MNMAEQQAGLEFDYLIPPAREKMVVTSAEQLPRLAAPPDYYPEEALGPCVYDDPDADEIQDFYPGVWWLYYGGDHGRRWVLRDHRDAVYMVKCAGFGGDYEVSGPCLDRWFRNAYDAFWTAERNAVWVESSRRRAALPGETTRRQGGETTMAEEPYEFDYLAPPERQKITIASADELPREVSPPDYYPEEAYAPCVYDDEDTESLQDFYPGVWWVYFAGGNNRPHWVMRDDNDDIYLVECQGFGGNYQVCGPGFGERFDNAYDAFWTAEQKAVKAGLNPGGAPSCPEERPGCETTMAEQTEDECRFDYMAPPERRMFTIESADELPREVSPEHYYPVEARGPCVYDGDGEDEEFEEEFYPGVWWVYFAGGSNRRHWVMRGYHNDIYMVERSGIGYEVNGPDVGQWFANAYDAFWTAEQAASRNCRPPEPERS